MWATVGACFSFKNRERALANRAASRYRRCHTEHLECGSACPSVLSDCGDAERVLRVLGLRQRYGGGAPRRCATTSNRRAARLDAPTWHPGADTWHGRLRASQEHRDADAAPPECIDTST